MHSEKILDSKEVGSTRSTLNKAVSLPTQLKHLAVERTVNLSGFQGGSCMADHVECPECSKKTVVQRQDSLYQCLSCDFKRDFSESPQSEPESDKGLFWTIVVTALLVLLSIQTRQTASNTPNLAIQSSPAPIAVRSHTN